jgi:hypothetical protein
LIDVGVPSIPTFALDYVLLAARIILIDVEVPSIPTFALDYVLLAARIILIDVGVPSIPTFVLDYVLLASRIILIDVGVPSIPTINGSPPTCCPRCGMNKMNPVTTTVMNLTGSFLEVLEPFFVKT